MGRFVTKAYHNAMIEIGRAKRAELEAELDAIRAELKAWQKRESVSTGARRPGKTLETLEQANAVLGRFYELSVRLDENRGTKHIARRIRAILGIVGPT